MLPSGGRLRETCHQLGSPGKKLAVKFLVQAGKITGDALNFWQYIGVTGKKKKNELGKIFHQELFEKRENKYSFLSSNSFENVDWLNLINKKPYYFFVPKDFELEDKYKKGMKLNELFEFNNSGFETAKDKFIIKNSKEEIDNLKKDISENTIEELVQLFNEKERKLQEVKNDIENAYPIKALYRPFDLRHTLIRENSQGVMFRPHFDTVKHLLKENIGLLCCKRQASFDFQHTSITKNAVERCSVSLQTGEVSYVFPLYLYPDQEIDGIFTEKERKPYLNTEIAEQIAKKIGLKFTNEKEEIEKTFAPIDILDYIYAVLHSPTYHEKYKEFFKIDFPRVPYPKNKDTFWKLGFN